MWADLDGMRSPPWLCQLVHADAVGDAIVLDLIALEPCPADATGCPRHTPFTVHIGHGEDSERGWEQTLALWAADADLVTILCGRTDDGSSWLCLSSGEQHLLLQL
jgi:hypothetical protein